MPIPRANSAGDRVFSKAFLTDAFLPGIRLSFLS
jgi:hypothetical protein